MTRFILSLTFFLSCAFCANAQVTVRDNTHNTPILRPKAYDSLTRFSYKGTYKDEFIVEEQRLRQYIGHKIYFIPFVDEKEYNRGRSLWWYVGKSKDKPDTYEKKSFRFERNCMSSINECLRKEPEFNKRGKEKKKGIKTAVYRPGYDWETDKKGEKAYRPEELSIGGLLKIETPDQKKFYTPAASYEGVYFTILDFQSSLQDATIGKNMLRMILKDEQGDTLAMENKRMGWEMKRYPEFMLLSFYEKVKKLYSGKDYVLTPPDYMRHDKVIDINTGYRVNIEKGSQWSCQSFDFLNSGSKYLEPFLIMKNSEGAEIKVKAYGAQTSEYVHINSFTEKESWLRKQALAAMEEKDRVAKLKKRQEEREAEKLARVEQQRLDDLKTLEKYGDYYGKLIIEKKVVIGMTKEMCRKAWGSPLDIYKTTLEGLVSEQWVYSLSNYLYFDNGKLTAIQN
ncbi:MAG: hypothetical protein HEP71_33975 [Roseivirga sp.]|nr:hypothetical protein [Roseivirga sp.]